MFKKADIHFYTFGLQRFLLCLLCALFLAVNIMPSVLELSEEEIEIVELEEEEDNELEFNRLAKGMWISLYQQIKIKLENGEGHGIGHIHSQVILLSKEVITPPPEKRV